MILAAMLREKEPVDVLAFVDRGGAVVAVVTHEDGRLSQEALDDIRLVRVDLPDMPPKMKRRIQ